MHGKLTGGNHERRKEKPRTRFERVGVVTGWQSPGTSDISDIIFPSENQTFTSRAIRGCW
jgi:hypothetical protein